jgi:hypothetical protein
MTRQDQALPVKHLQHWKLRMVARTSILNREIRKQDRVWPGFAFNTIDFSRNNQTPAKQMFDRVNRASTQDPNVESRDLNPRDPGCDRYLSDRRHSFSFPERTRRPNDMPIGLVAARQESAAATDRFVDAKFQVRVQPGRRLQQTS